MEPQYLKITVQQGTIYYKVRYYSPTNNDNCYEVLILREDTYGNLFQGTINLNKAGFANLCNNKYASTKNEFEAIRTKVLGSSYEALYGQFYNQWKEYYSTKKACLTKTKNMDVHGWDYWDVLEDAYLMSGVYPKRDSLILLEQGLIKQNNPSLYDIFQEARSNASFDYVNDKF